MDRWSQRWAFCMTLSLLTRIQLRMSYWNFMLGRTPKLDLQSPQRKMISGGRGGYCLEQNMLFREGLRSLGYKITSLQGRVRGLAIDAPRPADTCCCRSTCLKDRTWLT